MSPTARRRLVRVSLALFSTALSLLLIEVVVRALRIDDAALGRALYYQGADLSVHVATRDFLHYRLRPNSAFVHDDAGARYAVHVGAHGARLPDHAELKTPGALRVLCVGGSTTYGANVDDAQTMPAQLEAALSRRLRRPAEVWNYGTSGYTLAQAARLARERAEILRADVIVVQMYNRGRRPFLQPPRGEALDVEAAFAADPRLWEENFPAALSAPLSWCEARHQRALRWSALYRVLAALKRLRAGKDLSVPGDALSRVEAGQLLTWASARGVTVLFVAIPAMGGHVTPENVAEALPSAQLLDLHQEGREAAFYLVHPPAAHLRDFATQIAARLATLLPGRGQ